MATVQPRRTRRRHIRGDCDDGRALVNPVGIEYCDELDNDCDDLVDEACEGESPQG